MKKVAIVGHFAFGKEFLDGQTVKTKILAQELERVYGTKNVKKIDILYKNADENIMYYIK